MTCLLAYLLSSLQDAGTPNCDHRYQIATVRQLFSAFSKLQKSRTGNRSN